MPAPIGAQQNDAQKLVEKNIGIPIFNNPQSQQQLQDYFTRLGMPQDLASGRAEEIMRLANQGKAEDVRPLLLWQHVEGTTDLSRRFEDNAISLERAGEHNEASVWNERARFAESEGFMRLQESVENPAMRAALERLAMETTYEDRAAALNAFAISFSRYLTPGQIDMFATAAGASMGIAEARKEGRGEDEVARFYGCATQDDVLNVAKDLNLNDFFISRLSGAMSGISDIVGGGIGPLCRIHGGCDEHDGLHAHEYGLHPVLPGAQPEA